MSTVNMRANLHKLRTISALCGELALSMREEAHFVPEGAEDDSFWLTANEPSAARMMDSSDRLHQCFAGMTVEENNLALELAEQEQQERAPGLVMWGSWVTQMAEFDRITAEDAATKGFWDLRFGETSAGSATN